MKDNGEIKRKGTYQNYHLSLKFCSGKTSIKAGSRLLRKKVLVMHTEIKD